MNHFFLFFFHIVVYLFLSANVTNVQGDRGTVHGIDGVVHVVVEHIQLPLLEWKQIAVVHVVGEHHVYGPRTTCTMCIVHCTWSLAQIHSLFVAHRLLSTSPAC